MKFPTLDHHRKRLLLGGVVALCVAGGALAVAQTRHADRDPASMPRFDGTVAQYDLTPRGDVDGLILADGTEVHFPPHVGPAVMAAIRPGDAVIVHGNKSGPVVLAGSVTSVSSGATVVDRGPPPGGPPRRGPTEGRPGPVGPGPGGPAPVGPGPVGPVAGGPPTPPPPPMPVATTPMDASGTVKMALHGPRGELNGALMADGTVVHLPPDQASTLVAMLQPGQSLVVHGDGVQNEAGRAIDARRIGPSEDKLTVLTTPPLPR